MPEQQHDDEDAGPNRGRVAVAPRQLRDVGEVHAIPARNQRKRHEYRAQYGEYLHDLVLFDIYLCLIRVAGLRYALALSLIHI